MAKEEGAGKRVMGFTSENQFEETEKNTTINDIILDLDKKLLETIKELTFEKELLKHELELDDKIKEKIITLHSKISDFEKKIAERNKKYSLARGLWYDNPKKSYQLISDVANNDRKLRSEIKEIYSELKRNNLNEIDDIYKNVELSKEQILSIKQVINALSQRFDYLANHICSEYSINEDVNRLINENPNIKFN
ncbi:MAG: hypothetical protein WC755_05420 [Candidatus Woesearchaeota archaeon]|jgi:hypothetical protein